MSDSYPCFTKFDDLKNINTDQHFWLLGRVPPLVVKQFFAHGHIYYNNLKQRNNGQTPTSKSSYINQGLDSEAEDFTSSHPQ